MIPILRISKAWRYYLGFAYGMQQPCLVGTATLGDVPAGLRQQLNRIMSLLVPQSDVPEGAEHDDRLALAEAMVYWTAEIQRQQRIPVSRRIRVEKTSSNPDGSEDILIVLPCYQREAALQALTWISRLFAHLDQASVFDEAQVEKKRVEVKSLLAKYRPAGINRYFIADACFALDVPLAYYLGGKIQQLGIGCHARRLSSMISDQTSAMGVGFARNKFITAQVLNANGLPGARHLLVGSVDQAVEAATKLGYPLVVKPMDSEQGKGITSEIRDSQQLADAVRNALHYSQQVLVEKWQSGFTHRLTVLNDKVIRAVKRVAWGVTGDGAHSIEQLARSHYESDRNVGYFPATASDSKTRSYLAKSGRTIDDIPERGEYVRLSAVDNVNSGATNENIEPVKVHPDNLQLAIDVAETLGLDIAGIDLIIDDIERSWLNHPALICEVNAEPQLGNRTVPGIYRTIIQDLVGGQARIPVHLHICPVERQQELVDQLKSAELPHAVACRAGIWIDRKQRCRAFDYGFIAGVTALARRDIHSVALVLAIEELVEFGLPADWLEKANVHFPGQCNAAAIDYLKANLGSMGWHMPASEFERVIGTLDKASSERPPVAAR